MWELPFGRGRPFLSDVSPAVDHIVGGWQINTVTTWSSGLPFSPSYRDCGADRDTGPCRPDLVGDVEILGRADGWFTTASTTGLANGEVSGPWRRPLQGTFGTLSRNALRGPRFFQTDLAIFKNFSLSETIALQFRAESFNIFNNVNLGQPNTCIDCNPATDGQIFSLAPGAMMRQWQFGLRVEF